MTVQLRRPRPATRVLLALLSLCAAAATTAQPALDVTPGAVIPLGRSTERFAIGYGAALHGDFALGESPALLLGGLGFTVAPTRADSSVTLIDGGVGTGVRLGMGEIELDAGARAGAYLSLYRGVIGANPHASVFGGIGYRLGPGFRIGIDAGYTHFTDFGATGAFAEPLLHGVTAALNVSWSPTATAPAEPRIEIEPPRFDRVFPVLYRYYDESPLGSVEIINSERRTIRDVTVEFFVPQYMNAPKVVAEIDAIPRGERVGLPILALFTEEVLGITESTSVQAQVIVSYARDETTLTATRTETLDIQNRNQMTWDDDRKAAAFVASGDPTVQRLSRNITAVTRSVENVALNERLRNAIAIHETLALYGLEYVIDPDSSYIELSENENAIDYLQFPSQTLDFRAGDCDDLSILYASLMEAIGIPTAFVTIPGHIFMAFDLGIDEGEARRTFANPDDLIYHEGSAWVPVETTLQGDSFLQAWATGARQYREAERTGSAAFLPVREAWQVYEPTGFESQALALSFPSDEQIEERYRETIRALVTREIAPQVAEIRDRLARRESPRLYNRLGALYARYALYEDALAAFRDATRERPYAPAIHNIANIHYIRSEFGESLRNYHRALEIEPDNPRSMVGAARAHFALEQYREATRLYREAEILAPEIVAPFAYIVNESLETGRASSAAQRGTVQWEDE